MAIIGAILGDIAGSQYEYDKPDGFDAWKVPLFTDMCCYTDDTVMTLAVKKAIQKGLSFEFTMRQLGNLYPYSGYGAMFDAWIHAKNPKPYGSWGNGSAMRVSYAGEYFSELDDVKTYAKKSAEVTHDHPEGIKGAVVTAVCVWMAKNGKSKQDIFDYVIEQYPMEKYPYSIGHDMDYLREHCKWDASCQGSVPVAMRCFYESDSYESFLRNVLSIDSDADTLCAIGGGVAEEFYHGTGLDDAALLKRYLDDELLGLVYS